MAHLLAGLPVEVLGRMRADRVMRRPVPDAWPQPRQGGRPPKHGKKFRFARPETWGEPDVATTTVTDRYGIAQTMAFDRLHPKLTTRSAWIDHTDELPVIEGTVIRLQVDHLPGNQDLLPVWLWALPHGHDQQGRRPTLAVIPPSLRPGAHLPFRQADDRLDPPQTPH